MKVRKQHLLNQTVGKFLKISCLSCKDLLSPAQGATNPKKSPTRLWNIGGLHSIWCGPSLEEKCCWFNMLTFAYSFCDGYYKYLKIFGQMFSSQLSIFWWSVPTCGKFGDNWLKYLVQMFPEICTICGVNDFLSSFGFEVVGNEFAIVCSNICWSMPQFVMRCLIIWKYLVMNLFNYFFTITLFWWEMHIFANIWSFICQYLVKYLFQYFKDNVYFLSLFLRITSHFWRLSITITLLLRLFDNLKILRLFNGIGLFQKHNLKGSF